MVAVLFREGSHKVDRSAAYMCRWVAKNIVAKACRARRTPSRLRHRPSQPTSVTVDTFGTNQVSEDAIIQAVLEVFGFKPADIVNQMDILRPIYQHHQLRPLRQGRALEDTGKADPQNRRQLIGGLQ